MLPRYIHSIKDPGVMKTMDQKDNYHPVEPKAYYILQTKYYQAIDLVITAINNCFNQADYDICKA